jgi:O-antigen biosynthesis protein
VVHRRPVNGHICRASNDALALVQTPWVALLDHDDVLREHALLLMAEAIGRWPDAQVLYSDEDKLAIDGTRCDAYFKPDWNPELLLAQNYLCHLVVYRSERMRELGGFRVGFEGAQDHDLALRMTAGLPAAQIVHVPHVLYHWRQHDGSTASRGKAKPYAVEAGLRAVRDHLRHCGVEAEVENDKSGWHRIRPAAPTPPPQVTIVIPTRDGRHTLPRCIRSIRERTRYPNHELLIVDNGSVDPEFLAFLTDLAGSPRCRVMRDDRPFNYAQLNNAAVAAAAGEFVLLLNDDTEVVNADWLDILVGWAVQPGVGAVGARLWYGDHTLQHAGVVLGIGDVAGHAHRHLLREQTGYRGRASLVQDFSAVTAACLLVRRSLYQQVGGLDEAELAVAFNDVDFCLKLRAAGLRNVWTPDAELMHHESVSRGSDREPRHRARYEREVAVMQRRWGALLAHDPAYNPNLTNAGEDFSLAEPPRVSLLRRWFDTQAPE